MERITALLVSLGLVALAGQSPAQDTPGAERQKLRNDPTYSTHNYKHPNKAAAARRWESASGVVVQQPMPGSGQLANYKRQVPRAQPTGGITVDHTPSTDVADRNYKMQRVQPAGSVDPSATRVARKQRKADTTAANGQ